MAEVDFPALLAKRFFAVVAKTSRPTVGAELLVTYIIDKRGKY